MARENDAAAVDRRAVGRGGEGRGPEFELGSYFRRLRRGLDGLERGELVERLVAYAGRLAAGERERLLAELAAEPEKGSRAVRSRARRTKRGVGAGDSALLDDVASFVVALERGDYVQGWGWDDDIGEERMWGDERWALEMDVLFARADDAFFTGDLELAREAYGSLLRTFVSEPAIEGFCGPEPPEDMVDADLSAAKARYFRAIYLTEAPEARAERLVEAAQDLAFVGSEEVGIGAMADADAPPLPDQDAFLEAWTAALEKSAGDPMSGWTRLRKWLLREAAERGSGVAGLEALARGQGAWHPEAYGDWMQALRRQGRVAEALAAGREGLAAIAEDGGRAWLADAVADLAARRPEVDPPLAFDAARAAWRAGPSADRLLRLYGCRPEDEGARELLIEDELAWLASLDPPPPASLLARLQLLAGHYWAVALRLREAPQLGWSDADHPGRVAMPGLLGAAMGAEALPPPAHSRLAELWEAMAQPAGWRTPGLAWGARPESGLPEYEAGDEDADDGPDEEDLDDEAGADFHDDTYEDGEEAVGEELGSASIAAGANGSSRGIAPPLFSRALTATLRRSPLPPSRVDEVLTLLSEVAHDRVEAIVRAQYRNAYARAAGLVAACAEGQALAGRRAEARQLIEGIRQEFGRFYAFRGELDAAVASSTVLGPDHVPPGRRTARRRRGP